MDAPLITFEKLQAIESLSGELADTDYEQILTLAKGKDWGEHYTPSCVCKLIAALIGHEVGSVYDPACGTGNLLLSVQAKKYYGQEINPISAKICRLNMSRAHKESYIALGDTLSNPAHTGKFDAIVSNPPYSVTWQQVKDDIRFPILAPKSKGDLAFTLHCLSVMSDDGLAVMVMFPGVFYRGGAEQKIREYLIEYNYIDAIISLPEKLFETTQIAVNILILRKNRKDSNIFFMNASSLFNPNGKRNTLTDEHISQIAAAYHSRNEKEGISKVITPEQVRAEGYNLSISTYIESEQVKEDIDIDRIEGEIWQGYMNDIDKAFRWYLVTMETRAILGMGMNPYLPDLRQSGVIYQTDNIKVVVQ